MSKNAKQKKFQDNSKGLTSAPTVHEPLATLTQRLFTASEGFPRCLYIKTAGDLVINDSDGTSATYPVLASQQFIFENMTEIEASSVPALNIQW